MCLNTSCLMLVIVLISEALINVDAAATCKNTQRGKDYSGTLSVTKGGIPCQRWDAQTPHAHSRTDSSFPGDGSIRAAENYCRNPSNHWGGPWCHTSDPKIRWQECDIPMCGVFVHEVKPHLAGRSGATRLTIHGTGFADPYAGTNDVTLVSSTRSFVCDPHLDGTTSTMLTCNTRAMPEGNYQIRVQVDGVSVAHEAMCYGCPNCYNCRVIVYRWRTPYIYSVVPRSGPPGTVVTMRNVQYTDAYGSNAVSSNGKSVKILRSYAGSQECRLKNENDTFYKLKLDSESSDWGHLACKVMGSEIGGVRMSFIVSGEYSRSMPQMTVLNANSLGKVEMYQQYAEILSVSPSSGSTAGGTRLTVSGRNFDNSAASPVMVDIAGVPCKVQSYSKEELVCVTGPAPSSQEVYPGNRGSTVFQWNQYKQKSDLYQVANETLFSSSNANRTDWYDALSWADTPSGCDPGERGDYFVTRMEAFFAPPWSGEYKFYVKSDDQSEVYFSEAGPKSAKVRVAEAPAYRNNYFSNSEQSSQRYNLTAGQRNLNQSLVGYVNLCDVMTWNLRFQLSGTWDRAMQSPPADYVTQNHMTNQYYIEVVESDARCGANAHVAAKYFNSPLLSNETGDATEEVQKVQINSAVIAETQVLTLTSLSSRSGTKEVQKVAVQSSDSANARFRLGLGGVYTRDLNLGSSANDVRNELRALAVSVGVDSVSKKNVKVGSSVEFIVTFSDDAGNLPKLTSEKSGSITVSISQTTAGVGTLKTFVLTQGDGISDPIPYNTDADTLKEKIGTIYQGRCPTYVTSPSYAAFKEDFEESSPSKWSGYVTSNYEPFCGFKSLMNPNYIIKDKVIDTDSKPFLCFAYRGLLKQLVRLSIKNKPSTNIPLTLHNDTSWHYVCVDVKTEIQALLSTSDKIYLKHVRVYPAEGSTDNFFIDQISVTPTALAELDSNKWRLAPPSTMQDVVVTQLSDPTQFQVELSPRLCANNYELFSVQFGSISSGRVSGSSLVVKGTWPSGAKIGVTRTTAATPPVTGTFTLTYKGKTTSALSVDISDADLRATLEAETDIGPVDIDSEESKCYLRRRKIQWLTSGGNQPKIEADASGLSGTNVTLTVTEQDGNLFLDPIMGDFIRTVHSTPQVSVMVQGLPAACSGTCDFTYSSGFTPTVTGVSPSSGSSLSSTVVTINGTRFDANTANNTVMIGGVACTVASASSTQLTCSVGNGPIGAFNVEVTVDGLGLAEHQGGPHTFEYESSITGINPTTGSIGGGTSVTISGTGFGTAATVTFDGVGCSVVSRSYTKIVCNPASVASAKTVDVLVIQGATNITSPDQYSYNATLTSTVTSTNLIASDVWGGEQLTVVGTLLGTTNTTRVSIGEKFAADVTVTNETELSITLPSVTPGCYDLNVVTSTGLADIRTNNISKICYKLRVDNVTPLVGSNEGGTKVTITGQGFSTNTSLNSVTIGASPCEVQTASATEIVCMTTTGYQKHNVDNMGYHPVFGIGYAWSPQTVNIEAGDTVTWQWDAPFKVEGITYGVEQTAAADSAEYDGSGFKSPRSKQGGYRHQFNDVGTFFYWSNSIESSNTIKMRGKVVVSARQDFAAPVRVKVAGYEADYAVNSGVSDPVDGSSCPGGSTKVTGCSGSPPSGADATKFNFAFWKCKTPTVSGISRTTGTSVEEIVITGDGFSSTKCRNEIKLGDDTCTVSASSKTEITCLPDTSGGMAHGRSQLVTIRVGNTGYATMTSDNKTYALLPHIASVSPNTGSTEGETYVTIVGNALDGTGDEVVYVAGKECEVQSVNYTQIVCKTAYSGLAVGGMVQVIVYQGYSGFVTQCSSAGACNFNYTQTSTPTLSAVAPQYISGPASEMNITGVNFGTDTSVVTVSIGDVPCVVNSVVDDLIQCTVSYVPVYWRQIRLHVGGKGLAHNPDTSNIRVRSTAETYGISPASGSQSGGTRVTITGNGFVSGDTTVTIGGVTCIVTKTTLSQVECTTPPGSSDSAQVSIRSRSKTYPTVNFAYNATLTPSLFGVSPSSGEIGDVVTLNGSGFGTNVSDVEVHFSKAVCDVTSVKDDEIICNAGPSHSGSFDVQVYVANKGYASGLNKFEYVLTLTSISPATGSFGGGQNVTISGSGFRSNYTSATVCGEPCTVFNDGLTSSGFTCATPPAVKGAASTTSCPVVVTVDGQSVDSATNYTYDESKTPRVTKVEPARGGTMGGTVITITGTGFSNTQSDNKVSIGGSPCIVSSSSTTQIICTTEKRRPSIKTNVIVEVDTFGNSGKTGKGSEFFYIDRWSSPFTWGNMPPPGKGEIAVIPKGEVILLDNSTEVLKMLIIQGSLIFDEVDVELQAENILVTSGGLFQVGTEEEPFQHKATITLHGHLRSKELPIYGTKSLAVREGTLDLHGRHIPITWTRLASTAAAGATQIVLEKQVNWQVGDEIVIASTGHRHSQRENEKKKISAIANDNVTLTLTSALEYEHLGVSETYGSRTLEKRAEVGLLSHNVRVRGSRHAEWNDVIEACPNGFDTGEFVTQTCFQGRFGEEMGSDQFGAQIVLHSPKYNDSSVTARIEYVEVTYAGQAFRLGRYPIHFHLLGDASHNYVRGCGIHETFNRAVNIHNTHNLLVERTVIYNIMGGSFFLEDGIETGNTLQYNLAVFVKSSTSLLNDDITPAAYWVTNPDNTIQHNVAAGGTHFGIWYRMHEHPEGPSATTSVCQRHVPVRHFDNNTVHSQGWFGIWLFQDYYPMEGGSCSSNKPAPGIFHGLTAWNCEKGAEWVNGGAIQFHNFFMVGNEKAGIEGKRIVKARSVHYKANGPLIKDSVIASYAGGECTTAGIVVPFSAGLTVSNVSFVDFNSGSCAAITVARIDGTCSDRCGGWEHKFEAIEWINSPNRANFDWDHDSILGDLDGTLTGTEGARIIPSMDTLPLAKCSESAAFSIGVKASLCQPDVRFTRFAMNNIVPDALNYKNIIVSNSQGNNTVPWLKKRLTHMSGWMADLVLGEVNHLRFQDANHIYNITYNAGFYGMEETDWLVISHDMSLKPDRVFLTSGTPRPETSNLQLSYEKNEHGDWKYDAALKRFYYLISGKPATGSRRKRAVSNGDTSDFSVRLNGFRCYYPNCDPPPDPNTQPPARTRPSVYIKWSEYDKWNGGVVPGDGDDVTIKAGDWVVVDEPLPRMTSLTIRGALELDYEPDDSTGVVRDYTLTATYIAIIGGGGGGGVANNGATGRLIVGWEDNPYTGNCEIKLEGEHATPAWESLQKSYTGPPVGSKVIGVFGGLDLHGKQRDIYVTRLTQTAAAGSNTIVLKDPVDWVAGEEIAVATTSYSAWQTEKHVIKSVSSDQMTLTLENSLAHRHIGSSAPLSGDYYMAAEVSLLSRNIKVKSEAFNLQESFGARVLVTTASEKSAGGDTLTYTGFARIRNVEFDRTGQEGWAESYDARYSLAFISSGPYSNIKPSTVYGNSFHDGFSPAIGLFGADRVSVSSNVVHHTVGGAIFIDSDGVELNENLMMLDIWPGAYLDRVETANFDYNAAVEAGKATNLKLTNNVVVGAERAAYHIPGESCSSSPQYTNNIAHSMLVGIMLFKTSASCVRYSNFFIYKAADFGIYIQTPASIMITDVVLAENQVGFFPMILFPPILSHTWANKFARIDNSTIIGTTDNFDCSLDKLDRSDVNIQLSPQSRSWGSGRIGLSFATFTSGPNEAPRKPWANIMAYNTIAGVMKISGVRFEHFKSSCGTDVAVSTNPNNGDLLHPIEAERITWANTQEDSKILFHEPKVGLINPSDCVDMDCDSHKKCMVSDIDGTFLVGPAGGSVLPLAEFEWDGDKRRGIGDYRIPTAMLTDPSTGSRLSASVVFPNKGLYRGNPTQCAWNAVWNAYKCHDLPYRMMMIENLDADTELRRVSPVAVATGGYIDLINGPQDHGWCAGYTCQKRISTFHSLVALGMNYTLYFTGTTPQELRFMMLNADADDVIRLAIYYGSPLRLDLYYQDQYIFPTNSELKSDGSHGYRTPLFEGQYHPTIDMIPGSNFFDRNTNLLYLVVKGYHPIIIKTKEVVVISLNMPPVTVDDFYGANLVNNLAAFLDVPPEKIRIVNVVRESSRRKRRSTDGSVTLQIEIGDPPTTSVGYNETAPDAMSYDSLVNASAAVINAVQLGNLDKALNTTILNVDVVEPLPATTDAKWEDLASAKVDSLQVTVQIPASMELVDEPVGYQEGSLFPTQPKLRVLDSSGNSVGMLGSNLVPWQLTATLRANSGSDSRARIIGTTSIPYKNGWFNFTDLSISHSGSGYIIDFAISSPSQAVGRFSANSAAVNVVEQQLKIAIVAAPLNATINSALSFTVEVQDKTTGIKHHDIAWKSHTWVCTASLSKSGIYGDGTLIGTTNAVVDPSTSRATFTNLQLTQAATYFVTFSVVSTPSKYTLTTESAPITAYPTNYIAPVIEVSKNVALKFNADFSSVTGEEKYFSAMVENHIFKTHTNVVLSNFTLYEGSIVVNFIMSGLTTTVNTAIDAIASDVKAGLTLNYAGTNMATKSYMSVDGGIYNNLDGLSTVSPSVAPGASFPIGGIIGAVVGGILLLLIVVIIGVWLSKRNAKRVGGSSTSTQDEQPLATFSGKKAKAVTPSAKYDLGMKEGSQTPTTPRSARVDPCATPLPEITN